MTAEPHPAVSIGGDDKEEKYAKKLLLAVDTAVFKAIKNTIEDGGSASVYGNVGEYRVVIDYSDMLGNEIHIEHRGYDQKRSETSDVTVKIRP